MKRITAQELRGSLEFSQDIDGVSTSITEGHEYFSDNLSSWIQNDVTEDWSEGIVVMTPEYGDSFEMSLSEYSLI